MPRKSKPRNHRADSGRSTSKSRRKMRRASAQSGTADGTGLTPLTHLMQRSGLNSGKIVQDAVRGLVPSLSEIARTHPEWIRELRVARAEIRKEKRKLNLGNVFMRHFVKMLSQHQANSKHGGEARAKAELQRAWAKAEAMLVEIDDPGFFGGRMLDATRAGFEQRGILARRTS